MGSLVLLGVLLGLALLARGGAAAAQPGACSSYRSKAYCEPLPAAASRPARVPLLPSHLPPELDGATMSLAPCGPHARDSARVVSRFAVLGDIGLAEANCEARVARLLEKVEAQFGRMEFVVTTGDNNYWSGSCGTFARNVGDVYSRFFRAGACVDPTSPGVRDEVEAMLARGATREERDEHARRGGGVPSPPPPLLPRARGENASEPRFWPALGNHDWDQWRGAGEAVPHLQYFDYLRAQPGGAGGQWYAAEPVPGVLLLVLNSNLGQPGATRDERRLHDEQVEWARARLAGSGARHRLVVFHHPPYSTAQHDPLASWMQLPWGRWGATLVLSGHQHSYERLVVDGTTYVVNGLGGHPWLYDLDRCEPARGSVMRYNDRHGLMVGLLSRPANASGAEPPALDVCMYSLESGGMLVDHFDFAAQPSRDRAAKRFEPLSMHDLMDTVLAGTTSFG